MPHELFPQSGRAAVPRRHHIEVARQHNPDVNRLFTTIPARNVKSLLAYILYIKAARQRCLTEKGVPIRMPTPKSPSPRGRDLLP